MKESVLVTDLKKEAAAGLHWISLIIILIKKENQGFGRKEEKSRGHFLRQLVLFMGLG